MVTWNFKITYCAEDYNAIHCQGPVSIIRRNLSSSRGLQWGLSGLLVVKARLKNFSSGDAWQILVYRFPLSSPFVADSDASDVSFCERPLRRTPSKWSPSMILSSTLITWSEFRAVGLVHLLVTMRKKKEGSRQVFPIWQRLRFEFSGLRAWRHSATNFWLLSDSFEWRIPAAALEYDYGVCWR